MFYQFDEPSKDTDTDEDVVDETDDFVEFQQNRRFHSKPPSKARSNVARYAHVEAEDSSGAPGSTTTTAASATETTSSLTSDISSDVIPGHVSKDTLTTASSDGKFLLCFHLFQIF